MDAQLAELNQKIDALTAQVAYLAERAQAAERAGEERSELFSDLQPIAKDAMRLASRELEEVQEYVDLADLLRLLKKLARALPQMELLLDNVEGVTDLLDTVQPVVKEGMGKVTETMEGLERKGYFTFARAGADTVDCVVASLDEADLRNLRQAIPPALELVKAAARPESVRMAEGAVRAAQAELRKPLGTSLPALLRELNDPAVRRGLALSLRLLRVLGEQAR